MQVNQTNLPFIFHFLFEKQQLADYCITENISFTNNQQENEVS